MNSLLITALQEYLWQNSNHNLWRYKVNRTKTSIVIESYVQQQVSNQQLTDLWSSILFNMLKWPMGLCLHINVSMSITKKKSFWENISGSKRSKTTVLLFVRKQPVTDGGIIAFAKFFLHISFWFMIHCCRFICSSVTSL